MFIEERILKIKFEGLTQEIELVPVTGLRAAYAQKQSEKFARVMKRFSDGEDIPQEEWEETIMSVAKLICEFSNIETAEEVLKLQQSEIGYLFQKLQSFSSDPKASVAIKSK